MLKALLKKIGEEIKEFLDGPSFPVVQRTDFNWKGPLPDKVDWNWARMNIPVTPMQIDRPPTHCPECKTELVVQAFDPWLLEGTTQHSVYASVCPKGHGAWVEWM